MLTGGCAMLSVRYHCKTSRAVSNVDIVLSPDEREDA
jgi:hypothetical protein